MAVNDSVVYAVNGPVEADARQAREVAHIATGGQTGVSTPGSLEVKAQPTPDGTVRILPGGFVAQATPGDTGTGYASAPWQSYMRSIYQTTDRAIDPTDSTGPRTDVIGIEVVDPQFEGTDTSSWGDAEWGSHAFWRTKVIKNASPDAVIVTHFASMNRPFVPLARINIPASTGTITDDMITDLRFLAVERSKQDAITQQPGQGYTLSAGDSRNLGVMQSITVPQWATHLRIDGEVTGARTSGSGAASGDTRVVVKRASGPNPETDLIIWNASTGGTFQLPVAGRVPIYSDMRGRPLELWFRVNHNQGDADLEIQSSNSAMRLRLSFEENPTRS